MQGAIRILFQIGFEEHERHPWSEMEDSGISGKRAQRGNPKALGRCLPGTKADKLRAAADVARGPGWGRGGGC